MIKGPADYPAVALLLLDLIAFLLLVVAFTRLFAKAWKMPDRRDAIRRVFKIRPHASQEWPNVSAEANLILIGAAMGFVLFVVAGIWLVFVLRR